MTPGQRSGRDREARLLAGLAKGLTLVRRPNPVVIGWRWRYELGLAAGLPAAVIILISHVGWRWGLAEIGLLAATLGTWPAARWHVAARGRCVVTAHRLRTGCAQAWIHTRDGRLPVILLTRPIPGGERAHIWCRAGTSVADFEAARDLLRSACWAHDVQVARSTRYSHIVILDVIRHPGPGEQPLPEPAGQPALESAAPASAGETG